MNLLRQLGGLHLGFHNLEGDEVSRGPVLVETLGLEADGETALSQLVCRGIADSVRLQYDGRRRVRMNRRHC